MIRNPHKGFTLIETLVAITVVVTALVGPLYAVQQSLNASRSAREQLIASSLAQEAVEYVRYVRDNNYLYVLKTGVARTWLHGLDGTGGDPTKNCITAACVVDPTQLSVNRTITPLYLSTNNLYNQTGSGLATPYTRTIRITAVSGSTTEILLTVTVTWTSKGQARNVTITERLYDWL